MVGLSLSPRCPPSSPSDFFPRRTHYLFDLFFCFLIVPAHREGISDTVERLEFQGPGLTCLPCGHLYLGSRSNWVDYKTVGPFTDLFQVSQPHPLVYRHAADPSCFRLPCPSVYYFPKPGRWLPARSVHFFIKSRQFLGFSPRPPLRDDSPPALRYPLRTRPQPSKFWTFPFPRIFFVWMSLF